MEEKYLDIDGLKFLWEKIKEENKRIFEETLGTSEDNKKEAS